MRAFLARLLRPGDGLFQRVMSASFWAFAIRVGVRAAITIRTIILARILVPEDFGLMAIATLTLLFFERFTQTGFNAALVQRRESIESYLDTAWTLEILRNGATSLILVLGAPLVGSFFAAPEAVTILRVLAIVPLVKGFTNVAVVYLEKELRFDRWFIFEMSDKGTDVVVAIVAAFILRSVWALVLGVLAGALVRVIVSYWLHAYRPHLRLDRSQVGELFGFGKWVLGSGILWYLIQNLDDMVVGKILGVASLGLYRMAYNFSQAVATELAQISNQVAFPMYAKLQDSAERLRAAYFEAVHLVMFLAFPLALGTIVVAPQLTLALLGPKWTPMVHAMQVLSVAGLTRAFGSTAHSLFFGVGRPHVSAKFAAVKLAILAAVLYPAVSSQGLLGAAWATVIASGVGDGAAFGTAVRWVGLADPRRLMQAVGYPGINGLVMAGAVLGVGQVLTSASIGWAFVAMVTVGVVSYGLFVVASVRFLGYTKPLELIVRFRSAP